jgi:hypothetical protein
VTDPTAVAGCHWDPALLENGTAITQGPSKDTIIWVDPDASSASVDTPQYCDGFVLGVVVQEALFLVGDRLRIHLKSRLV